MELADADERWVEVSGSKILTLCKGTGPPVMFLHGYPETSSAWRFAFDGLANDYSCFAPDLPGWGRSTSSRSASLPHFIDAIASLIEQLRLPAVVLVGHDWGAAVAYGLALREPARVRRLITVNFSPCRFELWRAWHFGFFALPFLPDLIMRVWPGALEKRWLHNWANRTDAFPTLVVDSYRRAAATPDARKTTLHSYRHLVRRALLGRPPLDMGPTASRRQNPTAPWDIIWGMNDPVATPRVLDFLLAEFPGLRIERISGAGHFPHEETPAQFVASLRFLLADDTHRSRMLRAPL